MVTAGMLLLGCAWACGCGGPGPEEYGPVMYDFVESFSRAHFVRGTQVIDFGTIEARQHLLSGWSGDRRRRDGTTYVEGRGSQSLLEFSWGRRTDLEVHLRGVAVGARAVSLDLNRRHRERIELGGGDADYEVVFPKEAVARGTNRMWLRYDYGPRRANRSYRSVAIEMERIRLVAPGSRAARLPAINAAARELIVPAGAKIAYDLEIEGGSVITFRGPLPEGGPDARLAIAVRHDGEQDVEIARLGASEARRSVAIPGQDRRIVRLSFRALKASHPNGGATTVRLSHPLIRAPLAGGKDLRRVHARRIGGGKPWPNIIVYLIDTLRADHLGCYGYARPVSPHIDAFAADAVLFDHAMAQSSWTKPSVASLFTGVWPGTHGVIGEGQGLPDEDLTIAEILARAGMRTAAFVANGHVGASFGFAQGFDYFEMVNGKEGNQNGPPPRSEVVNRRVFSWLERRPADAPVFLYVHTVDPHSPYEPTSSFRWR